MDGRPRDDFPGGGFREGVGCDGILLVCGKGVGVTEDSRCESFSVIDIACTDWFNFQALKKRRILINAFCILAHA